MKRRALLAGCFASVLWPALAQAAPPTATELAHKVQRYYASTKYLIANFEQIHTTRAHGKKRKRRGVLRLRSGRFDFRYTDPKGDRVVCDGLRVKVFHAAGKRLYVTKRKRSRFGAILSFLDREGSLERSFKLRRLDAPGKKLGGHHVLEATPHKPVPTYRKVLFFVDGTSGAVARVMVVDAAGNTNLFVLSKVRRNKLVPKRAFRFKAPAGTKVVSIDGSK